MRSLGNMHVQGHWSWHTFASKFRGSFYVLNSRLSVSLRCVQLERQDDAFLGSYFHTWLWTTEHIILILFSSCNPFFPCAVYDPLCISIGTSAFLAGVPLHCLIVSDHFSPDRFICIFSKLHLIFNSSFQLWWVPCLMSLTLIMLPDHYDLGYLWQTSLTCSQFMNGAAESDPVPLTLYPVD